MSRRKVRKPRTSAKVHAKFEPRYLKQGVLFATTALVICLFIAAGAVEKYVKESGSPYVASVIAAVLVNLANDDRTVQALPELKVNPLLAAAAQAKADDMAAKGYFAHTSPEGKDSWYWFQQAGYDYQYAGENLAVNFADSKDVENAWMASPGHRENIVNVHYTEIGIAVATGTYQGREAIFAVQMFGSPKTQAAQTKTVTKPAVRPVTRATSSPAVLGQATEVIAPHEEESVGALAEQDGDASVITEPKNIPWWGYLLAQPKETLRYAYYVIGLLILAGLFFDVEWEVHKHHLRHAMKTGMVLATMSMLFIVADWVFFAEPIIALAQTLL